MSTWTVTYRLAQGPGISTGHIADVTDRHGCVIGRAAHLSYAQAEKAAMKDASRSFKRDCLHKCPTCASVETQRHDTFAGAVWECEECKARWFDEDAKEAA
jgi:ribosomal protein L37AE/L43A